jgi:hypothetical protein
MDPSGSPEGATANTQIGLAAAPAKRLKLAELNSSLGAGILGAGIGVLLAGYLAGLGSKATVRKMKQNLFWAAIYNLVAIPVAAGALYPAFGLLLRPEFGALAMSASSITVVTNALLLRRVEARLA